MSVSCGAAATRGAPDDQAEVVQGSRSCPHGEDGRELHRGARGAARARGGDGGQRPLATSDEAIRQRTGRGWEEWFDRLDEWGAAERPHREIARWVAAQLGIEPLAWNAQAIAGSYELARGLREVGEKPDGFAITASTTVAVPVERLYEAFVDESIRERWLPEGRLHERTATEPRSARFDWATTTPG